MEYIVKEGNYLIPGVTSSLNGLTFTFEAPKDKKCEIVLYKKGSFKIEKKILIPNKFSIGKLYSVEIEGIEQNLFDYNFSADDEVFTDAFAFKIAGREKWADYARKAYDFRVKGAFEKQDSSLFATKQELNISKEKLIMYKLNVRSFTMEATKNNKGTFQAVKEKISYFKKLGINCVEFMPIYEFEELILNRKEKQIDYKQWKEQWKKDTDSFTKTDKTGKGILTQTVETGCDLDRVNIWGYSKAFYFAPKESYAFGESAKQELIELINALHKNDIECVLEMYFPIELQESMIIEILKFWTREYHVDGFHLLGQNLQMKTIAQEPILKASKIFYNSYFEQIEQAKEHFFVDNEEFLYSARKMLSFQDASLFDFIQQMKKQSTDMGFVNYICDNNGYTLADLFAYNEKHNEANLENNLDGNDWNYSTNCGVEGETRKKHILLQRKKLMKNAVALLLLAQGVPLLFSGDEFCNSQKGNNNAYCQDNGVGWINWKQQTKNKSFFEFVQKMIAFRKEHPVISLSQPMKMTDCSGMGYPDLSYHGEEAWQAKESIQRYTVGMLYCGDTPPSAAKEKMDMIYIAYNFHPLKKTLAVPDLDKKRKWYLIMDTACEANSFFEEGKVLENKSIELQGQSICILIGK